MNAADRTARVAAVFAWLHAHERSRFAADVEFDRSNRYERIGGLRPIASDAELMARAEAEVAASEAFSLTDKGKTLTALCEWQRRFRDGSAPAHLYPIYERAHSAFNRDFEANREFVEASLREMGVASAEAVAA